MDHPLPAPPHDALIRPWRIAAYVAVGIAAFELLLLLAIGGGKLTGFVADRLEGAARQQVLAPQTSTQGKPVARKPASATAIAKLPRSKTVVMVLNGNGRTGAAAAAASQVHARGYKVGAVTNAPRQVSRSIVMYRPGFAGEGRRLGKDIGVKLVTPLDGMRGSALGRAHVVFILGP